jgi:hypothetical protein
MRHQQALYLDTSISIMIRVRRCQRRRMRHTTLKTSSQPLKAASSDRNPHNCPITLILAAGILRFLPIRTTLPRPPTTLLRHTTLLHMRAHHSGSLHIMGTTLPIRAMERSARHPATANLPLQHTLRIWANFHSIPLACLKDTSPLSKAQGIQVEMVATTPHIMHLGANTHSRVSMVPRQHSIL